MPPKLRQLSVFFFQFQSLFGSFLLFLISSFGLFCKVLLLFCWIRNDRLFTRLPTGYWKAWTKRKVSSTDRPTSKITGLFCKVLLLFCWIRNDRLFTRLPTGYWKAWTKRKVSSTDRPTSKITSLD